ncbi:SF1B family DNA helicase RecD2 [Tuanshanicoccus lijuaniae]|uniref:SF1B family DNA helicase RecD2 n=1 Tax=Aerococcaceae bacterium zg-1292 TaxID=2774330 RepID=UPI004062FEE9
MNGLSEVLIVGQLDAIYFENPMNLYKVVRIKVDDEMTEVLKESEIVCTGQFATLHYDTQYEFYGNFTTHPKYGDQFAVKRYQQLAPTSEQGLVDYLSSDRFKGIGVILAQRIVETLGMEAIERIIQDGDVLKTVKGMTTQKQKDLREALLKFQGTERVFMQLSEWGFSPKFADKIYQKYKSAAIETIKENPYQLVVDIEGIGFSKADLLAEILGIEPDSLERIVAAYYTTVLEYCYQNGDTYLLEGECRQQTRKLLESARPYLIDDALMDSALDKAIMDKKLIRLLDGLMIPSLYFAEIGIAERLFKHIQFAQIEHFEESVIDEAIQEVIHVTGIQYDNHQQQALKLAIQSPCSIITGGPGTGKTTLVKGLITLHSILHDYRLSSIHKYGDFQPILLAAPTGRAAKRMNEMTNLPAQTIHRMIGYTRESNIEDFSNPVELDGKILIVDEMSMVDTWLMNWLIQAIPFHLQVVFVGDRDQLPSVGPGKVFNDLITSHSLPTIKLEKVYRQGADSTIISLAHEIRLGKIPADLLEKQIDRSFIPCSSNQVTDVVRQIVEQARTKQYDSTNMQVLAPMYKGPAGINLLNEQLQAIMNPPRRGLREITYFEQTFRVGDKVLQLVNNAEADVYNGDIGKIVAIFHKNETESNVEEILVEFETRELTYKRSDLDQLTLAYCCSVHKAQGSEYPLVVLPLVDLHSRLLRKDLLYTAVTRAKQRLVLVGNPNSFVKAATSATIPRATFLKDMIQLKMKQREQPKAASQPTKSEKDAVVEQESKSTAPVATAEVSTELKETAQTDKAIDSLTEETIWQIDPMIGMENLTPYDFL